jgi:hypothetical protein
VHGPGWAPGKIDSFFLHCLDDGWIDSARLDPGAFRLKTIAGEAVHECLRHLAARAVVNAHEEDAFFGLLAHA